MEDYIIRIYRRDEKNPDYMVGIVEEVGVEERKTFHSIHDLITILAGPKGRSRWKKDRENAKD